MSLLKKKEQLSRLLDKKRALSEVNQMGLISEGAFYYVVFCHVICIIHIHSISYKKNICYNVDKVRDFNGYQRKNKNSY